MNGLSFTFLEYEYQRIKHYRQRALRRFEGDEVLGIGLGVMVRDVD